MKKCRSSRRTLTLPEVPWVRPRRVEFAAGGNQRFAQLVRPHGTAGSVIVPLVARDTGSASPARLAAQTPRSVINAVTSLAGVTSNARLSAGLPSGITRTVSIAPEAVRPVICVSSVAERSSIGISRPDRATSRWC